MVDAAAILSGSSKASGNVWKRYREVQVTYSGEWTTIAAKIQPVLVDRDFRQKSVETYDTRSGNVEQFHFGPGGTKVVRRAHSAVDVIYNGNTGAGSEAKAAAALVADAYTMFTFGASWLAEKAEDLEVVGIKKLADEQCFLIQGRVEPGFGFSGSDSFIAWIGSESRLLRRVQFTIEGLESTQGADVSVDFSGFEKAADGSIWPTHFLERVQRPIPVKAHEWNMQLLKADGRILLPD
jgi:hypothetical protein